MTGWRKRERERERESVCACVCVLREKEIKFVRVVCVSPRERN